MENNKCYNCNYLERYYVRGGQRFNKSKCGFCQKSHEVVHTDGSCEKFVNDLKAAGATAVME